MLPDAVDSSNLQLKLLLPVILVAMTVIAHANSFAGVFVFDDIIRIVQEERIRRLWPIRPLLSGERPVVDLSLAVNHALGGHHPWGYHAFNLAVHILAGLTLFGVVHRTIRLWHDNASANRQFAIGNYRFLIAFSVALIFLVHPLQTQSVTYVIQRGESMMGLFYLLTLYCAIRALDSPKRLGWSLAATLVCALGMGTKAVMVTAPLMIVVYDWVFLAGRANRGRRDNFQKRLPLYVGLFATWSVLWLCGIASEALSSSSTTSHVGFSYKGISALQYAATQPGVICKYLQLALWPASQCLDYDWPIATNWQRIVPPAIFVGVLLALTVWLLYRRHWLGFAGAWFFLILAPTSSFVPIKDVMFEHRMYLPLAAVIAAFVLPLGIRLAKPFAIRKSEMINQTQDGNVKSAYSPGSIVYFTSVVALTALLVYATHLRNRVYHSELTMWQDVVAKRPGNPRAYLGIGVETLEAGNPQNAIPWFRKALSLKDAYADGHFNLGIALAQAGLHHEAIPEFLRTVQLNPARSDAWINAARSHTKLGNFDLTAKAIREAIRIKPEDPEYHYQLANAMADGGDLNSAASAFRTAIQLNPAHASARINLGNIHLQQNLLNEAEDQYEQALATDPGNTVALVNLGRTLLLRKQPDSALEAFRRVPADDVLAAEAKLGAGRALVQMNRIEEAKQELHDALRLDPRHGAAIEELARLEARGEP